MFNQQMADENKAMFAAAKAYLGNWSKDQLYNSDLLQQAAAIFAERMSAKFPGVTQERIRARFYRAAATLRGRHYRNEGLQNRGENLPWIEHLAKFPPPFWRKARQTSSLTVTWRFTQVDERCGCLSANLRYDAPNGMRLWAVNSTDIYANLYTDGSVGEWQDSIAAAAKELSRMLGVYVSLCDKRVFGKPLDRRLYRDNGGLQNREVGR